MATPNTPFATPGEPLGNDDGMISRKLDTICLFDVDGTVTTPRQSITPEMDVCLQEVRKKCLIGLVGGSDIVKIAEQIGGTQGEGFQKKWILRKCLVDLAIAKYDYVFAENGLVGYKNGVQFFEEVCSTFSKERFVQLEIVLQNIQKYVGDDDLQTLINYCLKYLSEIRLPFKRYFPFSILFFH